jgi:hypothetical protein
MNTTRKSGPASVDRTNRKPRPISPDDERLARFIAGPISEETKAEIAKHRARYVEARKQRAGDPVPSAGPVTVRAEDGSIIIRPLRFEGDPVSGMMPLEDGGE